MPNFCLFGSSISHSISPVFQSAGLQALGYNETYVAQNVNLLGLQKGASDLRSGQIQGANITFPYKKKALKLADNATTIAKQVGAANTWWIQSGKLWATNTDVIGVLAAIKNLLHGLPEQVILLGSGGAAAATAYALINQVERITIINRSVKRAQQLALQLLQLNSSTTISTLHWPEHLDDSAVGESFEKADLVVQATSLPFSSPKIAAKMYAKLPWHKLHPVSAVLDLAYGEKMTQAVQIAQKYHLRAEDGATMLLYQGALSLQLWTNQEPPLIIMRDALSKALKRPKKSIPISQNYLNNKL